MTFSIGNGGTQSSGRLWTQWRVAMMTALLDLLSTSATNDARLGKLIAGLPADTRRRAKADIRASHQAEGARCIRRAPFIYYETIDHHRYIVRGCCNDWTCPRCGQIRARHEYGRIVLGANELHEQGHKLYFWTFTCRGKEMSIEEAEQNYLLWTHRLLDASRLKAKRAEAPWCYMQVTERQKRQHPHSHLLSSYMPADSRSYSKGDQLPNGRIARHDTLWSDWFRSAVIRVGLGQECEISEVVSPVGVAVYIAKYLFKESMSTKFPKGWRRVRYSQNFPKLPDHDNVDAFPLIRMEDWQRLQRMGVTVYARDMESYEAALARWITCVVPLHM